MKRLIPRLMGNGTFGRKAQWLPAGPAARLPRAKSLPTWACGSPLLPKLPGERQRPLSQSSLPPENSRPRQSHRQVPLDPPGTNHATPLYVLGEKRNVGTVLSFILQSGPPLRFCFLICKTGVKKRKRKTSQAGAVVFGFERVVTGKHPGRAQGPQRVLARSSCSAGCGACEEPASESR